MPSNHVGDDEAQTVFPLCGCAPFRKLVIGSQLVEPQALIINLILKFIPQKYKNTPTFYYV